VPQETDERIGAVALEELDDHIFEPSTLPEARQQQLQALFARMTADVGGGWDFRLELRRSEAIGANAFALPGGVVIVTDELVDLTANDQEIQAVLAHEIGHVLGRHSLRMLLQNSLSALVTLALLGDVSGAAAAVAAVPAVMVQAKHSRQFETEADQYAVAWLERQGLDRRLLRDLLERLEKAAGTEGADFGFLSTHPQTEERGK
jgi:predicted Zn-dependent protease